MSDIITCSDFPDKLVRCCTSCHEDADLGYIELSDFGVYEGNDIRKFKLNAYACCEVMQFCDRHNIDLDTITKEELVRKIDMVQS